MPRSLLRRTAAVCLTAVGVLVALGAFLSLCLLAIPDEDGGALGLNELLTLVAALGAGVLLVVLGTRLDPSGYRAPKGGW